MSATDVFAPAKINLTLHVTGQRDDGYHLLDSLVVFAPVGDRLRLTPDGALSLQVDGPEAAGVPSDGSNLVLRAARMAGQESGQITLTKQLPASAGIGGGSSDAAAVLRALGRDVPPEQIAQLGADVPMCMTPRPQRVQGIGEQLSVAAIPSLPALLVNPRVSVPTPSVFKALRDKTNPPMPETLPKFADRSDCIDWLATQRNDLQVPAMMLTPAVGVVLEALHTLPGTRLARMSGSGATCFALFDDTEAMRFAEISLRAAHPDWWIASGLLGDQVQKSAPSMATQEA
ncbi:4-(cytidine 5'-diphospho)-2-C-methyl-D-erythritol kinase [Thioclava sp. BHET1]|nr:4-(cytidine 5'-diphospho)-2-C-methyl-D-erythritol kinase [Thioclava sp. BHET1]